MLDNYICRQTLGIFNTYSVSTAPIVARKRSNYVIHTGCFIMFSVITNIYNKKPKGTTLIELIAATGKLKCFFDN
jgi:ABC-type thiamin/hydroxymethylpyrimidine transport system permease subunit